MVNAFYNEIEPYPVQWLQNLIEGGHIMEGQINDQSITKITPQDVAGYTRCHFFAGIGGWDYALQLANWPADRPVWTGSCPCQPFSIAGKQKGVDDERHLWPVWYELIKQCLPPVIFGEQVASPAGRTWLNGVFTDLEALGYACAGADLCAAGVAAPHIRQRLFWVAHSGRFCNERWGELGVLSGETVEAKKQNMGKGRRDNPIRQWQRSGNAFVDSVTISDDGVVHTNSAGPQQRGSTPTATRHGSSLESAGGDGRVAHTQGHRSQGGCDEEPTSRSHGKETTKRSSIQPEFEGLCSGGGVGHTHGAGSQGWNLRPDQPETGGELPVEPRSIDFWGDFDAIPCADQKARRIESGTFPLAHGVPARVGKLSAYGNAIVPQVAAAFIVSAIEAGV